jgi:hypothetical protein
MQDYKSRREIKTGKRKNIPMQLEESLVISKGFNQIVPKLYDGKDHVQGVQNPVVILKLIFGKDGLMLRGIYQRRATLT